MQHRASHAVVLVLAWCPVGAGAGAEFDLALVEVLLEVTPFPGRHVDVFVGWPQLAAPGQEVLVVLDHLLLEHRDVALSGLQVEVPEQLRADVDREAVVDQLGGKQPPKSCGVKVTPARHTTKTRPRVPSLNVQHPIPPLENASSGTLERFAGLH